MTRKRIHRPRTRGDPTAGDDAGSITRPPPGGRARVLANFQSDPASERRVARAACQPVLPCFCGRYWRASRQWHPERVVNRNRSVCLCSFMPPRRILRHPLETVAVTHIF